MDNLEIEVEVYRNWGLKVSLLHNGEEVSSSVLDLYELKKVLDRMED